MRPDRHSRRSATATSTTSLGRAVAALAIASALVALLVFVVANALASCSPAGGVAGASSTSTQLDVSDAEASAEKSSAPVSATVGSQGVTVTASEDAVAALASFEALARLDETTKDILDQGYHVGYVVYDLTTGEAITYNADDEFYPASSIKGPWLVSLYEESLEPDGGGKGFEEASEALIVDSDNETYDQLRETFSASLFVDWLDERGVSHRSSDFDEGWWYPHVTPRELCSMWRAAMPFLTGGTEDGDYLAELFSETWVSPSREVLGDRYLVWNKAGWYPDLDDYSATVDAGIVFSETGTYAFAVMSDAPEDFWDLEQVIDALNMTHASLTGGDASSAITEETGVANVDDD